MDHSSKPGLLRHWIKTVQHFFDVSPELLAWLLGGLWLHKEAALVLDGPPLGLAKTEVTDDV